MCVSRPDCAAFDFDRNDPPYKNAHCWIHSDTSIVMKKQPDVDHYRRDTCYSESGIHF